ncbi:hypothetical protein AKJ09_06831 [Labilithrix luteola]|uniref:Uncharacterized protein n=1 Tax=Labilithrix luteola TaxID=1391654 RepID=A0A0K1Q358_9BACT|nr:hypothetical protein AKJ09_06831 [Labilithrix luteola]
MLVGLLGAACDDGAVEPDGATNPVVDGSDGGATDPVVDGSDGTTDAGVDASDAGATDGGDTGVVNAQPNLPDGSPRVAARSGQEVDFHLAPVDPEGDPFVVSFKGCANTLGTIRLCKDAACTQTITLDCSIAHGAGTTPVVLDVDPSLRGHFAAGAIGSVEDGDHYNTAYFVLDDHTSPLPPTEIAVVFDVCLDNTPPTLFIQGEDRPDYEFSPRVGDNFLLGLEVTDPDFSRSDLATLTIEGTLDNSHTPTSKFDVAHMQASITGCGDQTTVSATAFRMTCTMAPVLELARNVKVLSPTSLGAGEGLVKIHIHVDDNGYYGQDPSLASYSAVPFPLKDDLDVRATYVP